MEKIDWQEITESLGEDRWRDDLVVMPRQSRLLLAKLVQENRFLARDSQQIYYGPDSQAELYDAAKTAYNSLSNPLQTEFIDMFINGDLVVNNDDLVVDTSLGRVGIGTANPIGILNLSEDAPDTVLYIDGTSEATTSKSANIIFRLNTDTILRQLVRIRSKYTDITDATRSSELQIYTVQGGTFTQRVIIGGGLQIGTPIGGDKGEGTVNLPVAYHVNGVPVIGDRKTGWSAPTGTASRTTFSTSTVTLESLAERLKGLIDDLIGHGLIGG